MVPTDVCNIALKEIGNQSQISSIQPSDGTPAGNAASEFYTPKIQMLLRAAPWDFARKTAPLTQLKATVVNGVAQTTNLPPTPFSFEYAWPSDCIKARFLLPTPSVSGGLSQPLMTGTSIDPNTGTYSTKTPFVVATDNDSGGNPIKVILTNLQNAQLVYTADLSQYPDLWESLFLSGATAFLASYFINALARNERQLQSQIAIAKNVLDSARAMNGNESLITMDHQPDWISARMAYGNAYAGPATWGAWTGWDRCDFPGGLSY